MSRVVLGTQLKCPMCEIEFPKQKAHQIFCSKRCNKKHWLKIERDQRHKENERILLPRKCLICDNEFKPQRPYHIYCSPKCARRGYQVTRISGIEIDTIRDLYYKQGGKCAICGEIFSKWDQLNIDHNHSDGKIRGLLCINCNFILGHAKDTLHILRNAIKYLGGGDFN